MPYWKKPVIQPFFSQATRRPIKEAPSVFPHPEIISKIQDERGNLISNKPSGNQGGGSSEPEKKKKKKKNLPCEKLIKKLVNHKDPKANEKKLNRLVGALERYIDNDL